MRIRTAAIGLCLLGASCASLDPAPSSSDGRADEVRGKRVEARQGGYTPMTFAVLGDFGSGTQNQKDIADRICRWRQNNPFDLVVTTGDNVYETGHPSRFEEVFFEPYACLLDEGVRFRATLGNHDILTDDGRPELDEPAFGLKARNYIVRKNGVRFVMVDSNNLKTNWLDKKLPAKDGDRWTIVAFHHPVFSSGAHGSTPGMRPTLPRLFRKHGVDLVLNGHDHNYEATKRLKGIRYVVTGGGGAYLRPCGDEEWFTDVCKPEYHFLYVRAGRDRIKVKAVAAGGNVIHRFTTTGR